ncbi:MAG: hypothetical protein KGS44_12025, partial [Alphaproteobacteria bacterium]|nr:hypothetical protein [Alphaproteobacteria bacterium]
TVRPQSYIGASYVQPVTANTVAIYAAARGGHVRAIGFDNDIQSYISIDLSLRAAHLFDYKTIKDLAYAKGPIPIVWAVSSDGRLLGLTYVPEQQVYAWHSHDTQDGFFESIAVVSEGNDDILYAVVRRTIGTATKRYVERLSSRYFQDLKNFFGVDCGLTYSGAAATTISGLSHLEGKTVYILADGAVMPPRVVSGGQITLDKAASLVHVGLPIVSDLQTLPLAVEVEAYAQATKKNVKAVALRVYQSSGIYVGPDADHLTEAKIRTTEPYGSPPGLQTGEVEVDISPAWTTEGQVVVRQVDPVPLTIVSMTTTVSFGG